MNRLWSYWMAAIDANVMVAGVLIVWAINAGMNGMMGWKTTSGGMAIGYAAAFVVLAAFGAWAATEQARARGLRKSVLCFVVILQLVFGQIAGWQTLGLTLSESAGRIESAVTQRDTLHDSVAAKRAELARLEAMDPPLRPVAALEAAAQVEKASRSRQFPTGEGPEWQRIVAELELAKRLVDLRADLPGLTAQLRAAPQVKEADALYAVPAAFGSLLMQWWHGDEARHIGPDDVRFFWLVFLVAVLEFVATFGFWLVGVSHAPGKPVPVVVTRIVEADPYDDGVSGVDDPFGVRMLPAPQRRAQLAQDRRAARAERAAAAAGGATNIINIGPGPQKLPVRVAARAAG